MDSRDGSMNEASIFQNLGNLRPVRKLKIHPREETENLCIYVRANAPLGGPGMPTMPLLGKGGRDRRGGSVSFRVEVKEDCTIEIQRLDRGRWHHTPFKSLEAALVVMKLFTKNDLRQAQNEKFEPEFLREARKEFNRLLEESPHGKRQR
jgi:hypothetical protein